MQDFKFKMSNFKIQQADYQQFISLNCKRFFNQFL